MSLVVGVGGRSGADAAALARLVESALADHGLAADEVAVVATLDRRAADAGVRLLAAGLGAAVSAYSAAALATLEVPSPSDVVRRHTGTSGVAEAAVIATGARLVCPKRGDAGWTVALGRLDPVEDRS